jgi:signal transduction histidine kinase
MAQFRAKARAVDLLGKGQIADLPTAITELWKNGYDAYADNLTAEIYLQGYKGLDKPLFVMTDDGKGMSRQDIFEKWLVLGTDSKSRNTLEEKESEETLWKAPRIKAGEKGIGRLSVAFLGNPMLMLTKKQGHPLQALFFDWRLLENYNLFLNDVDIPVENIDSINDFSAVFEELKKSFLKNFPELDEKGNFVNKDESHVWEESQTKLKNEIEISVAKSFVPEFLVEKLVGEIINLQNNNGTKFLIFEPIDQIIELANSDEDKTEDRMFVLSSLSGFTNVFKDEISPVKTNIPIYKEDNQEYNFLTSQGNFFEIKDYEFADIIIEGTFDGNASFNGRIKIYDQYIDHSYTNPRKKDSRNFYGSVPIKLGYSQGEETSSKLDEESFNRIRKKVSNYGGLYIYRDNFRVLPYGRENADFLRFEDRRSRRAGTYYFSYRRMFGYLGLSRNDNPNLKDKSSREGLINNAPYRAFESDLIAFFIDLAQEHFGDKAKQSIFLDKKIQLNLQAEALKDDKKRETAEKISFTKSLNTYSERFVEYQNEYTELLRQLEEKTHASDVLYSDIESILDRLQVLDIEYKNLLPKIPKRYKPTDTQLDRLEKFENKLISFNETIKKNSAELMVKVQDKLEVKELKIEFTKNFQKFNGTLERVISANKDALELKFDELLKDYSLRSKRILEDLNIDKINIINSINSKESVLLQSKNITNKFEFLREQIEKELLPLIQHLNKLSFDIDEELIQGAYKAEYDNIKYQWEQTRETAQLGVAVEIIDHEFNQLYAKINYSIDKLSNENLFTDVEQFKFLKQNFKQLEDKYDLLSPLYRISGVVPIDIKCGLLFDYLKKFFASKISSNDVTFDLTPSFKNHVINIKEPVIHTVLINIVNNAFYWIRNSNNKHIKFDYFKETDEILIINSGQKIEEHRLEKIFGLFYSNRPNGRGIGLYLSRQSLNECYFDIYATNDKNYNILNGACFVIKPLK